MSGSLSNDCKKRIKELEEKLVWSIQTIKDSAFRYSILSDLITFLAVSCRFSSQSLDEPCKKKMMGYEEDILNLNMRTTPERVGGLGTLLDNIRRDLNDGTAR